MLGWRVFLSSLLIPGLIAVFYFDARFGDSALLLFGFCGLIAVRGCWELADLLRVRSLQPSFLFTAPLTVSLLAAAWKPHLTVPWLLPASTQNLLGLLGLAYAAAVLALFGWRITVYQEPGHNVERLGSSLRWSSYAVIVAYIGIAALGYFQQRLPEIPIDAAPLGAMTLVFALSVIVLHAGAALRLGESSEIKPTVGADVLIFTYIGVLLSITAQLRWTGDGAGGYAALGSLIVAVKCGDIGAYTLGRLFGKRKMAPRLSPGKTWAGAFGAVLGAALAAYAWFEWAVPLLDSSMRGTPWYWACLYGGVLGVAGLVGDLAESLIKRDVGRKDAAALMPGFGGLLDLLDSVLYAGPCAYVLWQVLPLVRPH